MHQVERAIFDLRRGLPVLIEDGSALSTDRRVSALVYPLEGWQETELHSLTSASNVRPVLAVTGHRLSAMGHEPAGGAAALPLQSGPKTVIELYRAAVTSTPPPSGLFDEPRPANAIERAALALMRRALLVPVALTLHLSPAQRARLQPEIDRGEMLVVPAREAELCFELASGLLRRVSEAEVPLAEAPHSRFILFREPDGLREHVAVLIGRPENWAAEVPVRIHSACLTGDLFGSLRCDCGEQLRNGVRAIEELGGGVLLYLAQEGRGIGLANKLRAYALQDEGLDTVEADHVLGFSADERRYGVAVDLLSALEISRVRLLTNNPVKIQALVNGGIEVAGGDRLFGRVNRHNRRYLAAKASRSGHLLDDLLNSD